MKLQRVEKAPLLPPDQKTKKKKLMSGKCIGAVATLTAAVPPAATFIYDAAKDSLTSIDYIRKLDHNREKLEKELEELIAFANDIDQGRVKKEEIKNTSIYKVWRTRYRRLKQK
ncbi:hypothetical protein GH714_023520 [Hevea brasiliensis]|uniref:Uncharacterized protein n=1 Tax=Hevea brasiliensis TaxID=3981 RepID=A0A6A6N1X9_HEVBR|nr:hypothetical protein GH714_023520 [Hevea brasiliensis]